MSDESELESYKKALALEQQKVAKVEKLFERKTYELYQANELLKKQQETILKAEKMISIGRLTAGIAHEVNNPLTFVSSNLEILNSHLSGEELLDPAEVEEMMTDVYEGLDRIKSIINQVNNYARTEGSDRQCLDLNQAILSTLQLTKSRLGENIHVEVNLGQLPNLFGNENELKQVFLNLIINAIDAMQAKESDRDPEQLTVTTAHDSVSNHIHITISDTGIGIEKVNQKNIFEPFFTTKAVGAGSGLGLYVCHQIVSAHSGTIQVESQPDHGCRFTILLPADLRSEPR